MQEKRAVIYARYSSDKQREESIEGQLLVCHEFAKKNNLVVIKEYIDRAKSGTKANRAEFQKMIIDSGSHSFECVILYKTDRFARNEHDSIVNEHYLASNGVELLYATQPFLNNRGGRIIKAVFRVQDEEYSLNLSERTKLGLAMNVEKGQVITGRCPIGYKIENKKMVIDPSTVHIPQIIFDRYANGETTTAINEYLVSIGVDKFNINSINRMIQNKKYLGILTYNNKEYIDYHPAIIDKELFDRANMRRLQKNKHGIKSSEKYMLSGLLFNPDGKHWKGNSGTARNGQKHRYYSLGKKYIKKESIDDAVVKTIFDTISMKTDELAEIVYKGTVKQDTSSKLVDLKKQVSQIDKSIDNIIKAIKSGIFNASIKDELDSLEKQKIFLQSEINSVGMYDLTVDQIKVLISKIKKRHLSDLDKTSLVHSLVDKIVLFDDYGVIYYKIAGQSITFEEINGSAVDFNGAGDRT